MYCCQSSKISWTIIYFPVLEIGDQAAGFFFYETVRKKKREKKERLIAVYNEVFNECVLSLGVKVKFCCQFTNMFISNLLIF